MGSDSRKPRNALARCWRISVYGLVFVVCTSIICAMMWLLLFYVGLVSIPSTEPQRRALVHNPYSSTTPKPNRTSASNNVTASPQRPAYSNDKSPATPLRGNSRGEAPVLPKESSSSSRTESTTSKGDFNPRERVNSSLAEILASGKSSSSDVIAETKRYDKRRDGPSIDDLSVRAVSSSSSENQDDLTGGDRRLSGSGKRESDDGLTDKSRRVAELPPPRDDAYDADRDKTARPIDRDRYDDDKRSGEQGRSPARDYADAVYRDRDDRTPVSRRDEPSRRTDYERPYDDRDRSRIDKDRDDYPRRRYDDIDDRDYPRSTSRRDDLEYRETVRRRDDDDYDRTRRVSSRDDVYPSRLDDRVDGYDKRRTPDSYRDRTDDSRLDDRYRSRERDDRYRSDEGYRRDRYRGDDEYRRRPVDDDKPRRDSYKDDDEYRRRLVDDDKPRRESYKDDDEYRRRPVDDDKPRRDSYKDDDEYRRRPVVDDKPRRDNYKDDDRYKTRDEKYDDRYIARPADDGRRIPADDLKTRGDVGPYRDEIEPRRSMDTVLRDYKPLPAADYETRAKDDLSRRDDTRKYTREDSLDTSTSLRSSFDDKYEERSRPRTVVDSERPRSRDDPRYDDRTYDRDYPRRRYDSDGVDRRRVDEADVDRYRSRRVEDEKSLVSRRDGDYRASDSRLSKGDDRVLSDRPVYLEEDRELSRAIRTKPDDATLNRRSYSDDDYTRNRPRTDPKLAYERDERDDRYKPTPSRRLSETDFRDDRYESRSRSRYDADDYDRRDDRRYSRDDDRTRDLIQPSRAVLDDSPIRSSTRDYPPRDPYPRDSLSRPEDVPPRDRPYARTDDDRVKAPDPIYPPPRHQTNIREKRYQEDEPCVDGRDKGCPVRSSSLGLSPESSPRDRSVSERPLTLKEVIEAANRHREEPERPSEAIYPVFDPRVNNTTSPEIIRHSERRGTTITSKRKRK